MEDVRASTRLGYHVSGWKLGNWPVMVASESDALLSIDLKHERLTRAASE